MYISSATDLFQISFSIVAIEFLCFFFKSGYLSARSNYYTNYVSKVLESLFFSAVGPARFGEAYGETYGSPYDNGPFQTVPSGTNSAPDQWGHSHELGSLHTHPAFLSGMTGRDPLNPLGVDTKPLIQNGMLGSYPNAGGAGGPCFTGLMTNNSL